MSLLAKPQKGPNDGCRKSGCHEKLVTPKEKFVHGPIGVGSCRPCHRPLIEGLAGPWHKKGQMEIPVAKAKLCLPCHSEIERARKLRFKHKPVNRANCGYCHDPHASTERYLLRNGKPGESQKYCFMCHRDQKNFRRKVKHQPAVKGRCSRCHVAHGSSIQGLLRKSQSQLCAECHKKLDWRKRKVVHGPVAAGSCGGCHNPHSADHAKLLKLPKEKLCLGCHKKKRMTKIHTVIAGGNKKSCYACHEPHASNKPYLIKDRR
ncbi:MAG: hypothetical protein JRH20_15335 [Deltaproteobacteria bacterium]|nr:hypothetical protein [Deltaproteobacteria bacterium]